MDTALHMSLANRLVWISSDLGEQAQDCEDFVGTIVANDIIRCSVRQRSDQNTDIVNVYHFMAALGNVGTADSAFMAAASTYFDTMYATIQAQVPAAQVPVDIKIDIVQLIGGVIQVVRNVGTVSWGAGYDPSGAGESYALGVAIGVILRTLVGKVFGKKYIGAVGEVSIANQKLATGAPTTAFTNYLAAVLDAIEVDIDDFLPGVLSTRTLDFELFTEAELSTEVYYQRRRAIRSGS